MDQFNDASFHSSYWDHSVDMIDKSMAVIGTGASAIQLVSAVARQAARLKIFLRTPPWINPRADVAIPDRVRTALCTVPGASRTLHGAVYSGGLIKTM